MKRTILLSLFLCFLCHFSYAQSNDVKYEYAMVHLEEVNLQKNRLIIFYGNDKAVEFDKIKPRKLSKGNFGNLNNAVDAMNYMADEGYELVTTNFGVLANVNQTGVFYQYIFRKRK